ncbi:MAG: hypothetical protein JW910_14310 [Anaerolineae bacterium]|nr:hypothetical protein [Anaerolineae bacterium]
MTTDDFDHNDPIEENLNSLPLDDESEQPDSESDLPAPDLLALTSDSAPESAADSIAPDDDTLELPQVDATAQSIDTVELPQIEALDTEADTLEMPQVEAAALEEETVALPAGEVAALDSVAEGEAGDEQVQSEDDTSSPAAGEVAVMEEAAPEAEEEPTPASALELEPPAESGPASAAPPRIIAETPVGGRPRPVVPERETPARLPFALEPEVPAEDELPETVEEPPTVAAAPEPVPQTPLSTARLAPEPEPANTTAPAEWDEDISPELAAVLFGAKRAAPAAPEAAAKDEGAPPIPAAPPQPVEAAALPAKATFLTDIAQAKIQPITAQGVSAPTPEEQPQGKARYVRIEEPLKNDRGMRVTETWDYLKPDRPGLAGRLLQRVRIEETTYTDGSWHWKFERRYTDRGRDRREVRANTDHTYLERTDSIAKKDPANNQRIRVKEQSRMILAGPAGEEKRGFFSRLFRRSESDSGPKAWRPATSDEGRRARKQGGNAF